MDMKKSRFGPGLFLALVTGVMGYEWFQAGREKVTDAAFATGFPKTVATFASKNPNDWYQSFLNGPISDNTGLFATLVSWGELLVGIALIVGAVVMIIEVQGRIRVYTESVVLVALVAAAIMSFNFYWAAGWLSASTDGINTVMFWTEVVLGTAFATELVQVRAASREPRITAAHSRA